MKTGNWKNCFFKSGTAAFLAAMSFGCSVLPERDLPVLTAVWSESPVVPDGLPDDAVWSRCESYPLQLPCDRRTAPDCFQGGTVKLAYDERYLYVLAELQDDDIAQYGTENHTLLFNTGDVLELFLWPENGTRYWEFHGTPNGCYAAFMFSGPGRRILEAALRPELEFPTGVALHGTLNNDLDMDRGWTIELAVPLAELTKYGDKLDDKWRILVARYNYSKTLPALEYSASTRLPLTDFHRGDWYGRLRFRQKSIGEAEKTPRQAE